MTDETAAIQEPVRGRWQVVDPDGNVVDSGDGIFMLAVTDDETEGEQ